MQQALQLAASLVRKLSHWLNSNNVLQSTGKIKLK
jgi:hypothetical protein